MSHCPHSERPCWGPARLFPRSTHALSSDRRRGPSRAGKPTRGSARRSSRWGTRVRRFGPRRCVSRIPPMGAGLRAARQAGRANDPSSGRHVPPDWRVRPIGRPPGRAPRPDRPRPAHPGWAAVAARPCRVVGVAQQPLRHGPRQPARSTGRAARGAGRGGRGRERRRRRCGRAGRRGPKAEARFGRINGLIHAAGVVEESTLPRDRRHGRHRRERTSGPRSRARSPSTRSWASGHWTSGC